MRPRWSTLLVAAVVLLGGCGGGSSLPAPVDPWEPSHMIHFDARFDARFGAGAGVTLPIGEGGLEVDTGSAAPQSVSNAASPNVADLELLHEASRLFLERISTQP